MGSAYFLGFAISAGLTPTFADKFGRKTPYTISLITQTIAYSLIIYSKNLTGTILYYLLVGLCAGGRDVIGAMYQAEFMPQKYHVQAMTLLNCVDSTTMIFQSIYYYFCNYWLYLHVFNLCVAITIIVIVQFIPESPRFLYEHKRFDEAR
jgi:putative MFS transporter